MRSGSGISRNQSLITAAVSLMSVKFSSESKSVPSISKNRALNQLSV